MQTKKISNKKYIGGYIGLLMLLITVAVMAFIIVRTDLFKGFSTDQKNSKNIIEEGFDAINQSKNAKNLIEQNSRNAATQ